MPRPQVPVCFSFNIASYHLFFFLGSFFFFFFYFILNKNLFFQTIPALIKEITKGKFPPLSPRYSPHTTALVNGLLHLEPRKRPDTNEVGDEGQQN